MISRVLTSGFVAGFAAGLFSAGLELALVQPQLLLAEQYESGALVHFHGVDEAPHTDAAHSHDATEAKPAAEPSAVPEAHDHSTHSHDTADAPGQGDFFTVRTLLVVMFSGLVYSGFGLLLVAGYHIAGQSGRPVATRDGILWGLAGFAAFSLAPALGLPPELPGSIAADLTERQVWWLGTVLATAGGLALIAFGRSWPQWGLAIALLVGPHLIGAPHLDEFFGVAPPELAASFATRALGVAVISWAVLGALTAWMWNHEHST